MPRNNRLEPDSTGIGEGQKASQAALTSHVEGLLERFAGHWDAVHRANSSAICGLRTVRAPTVAGRRAGAPNLAGLFNWGALSPVRTTSELRIGKLPDEPSAQRRDHTRAVDSTCEARLTSIDGEDALRSASPWRHGRSCRGRQGRPASRTGAGQERIEWLSRYRLRNCS